VSSRRFTLRTRLTLGAVAAASIALALLIAAFNIVLDSHLRADADTVLRERATTVLRGLVTVNGRLSVTDAPDAGAVDAQTWIFVGARANLYRATGTSTKTNDHTGSEDDPIQDRQH